MFIRLSRCLLIQIKEVVFIPAKNQEFDSLLKLSSRAFANALMHITGEKPGIKEVLHQDVLTARLKRGILDLPVLATYGLCILYEFHAGRISGKTVLRNYQYAIDLRVEVDGPVKPHFVSLDGNKTPIPKIELFPGVFTNPEVTFLADIDGEQSLNTIKDKLENQVELDEMDAYCLALMPFFQHEKSREEVLEYMCHFINEIEISEEHKYIIKLVQILSVNALFVDEKQEEFLGVVYMESTYIARYEKNLIDNAHKEGREEGLQEGREEGLEEGIKKGIKDTKNSLAVKMKADGVSSDFIFKYLGIML